MKGAQYGEYPSRKASDLEQGDLVPNLDFRGLYSTVLEDWFGLDAKPIVKGTFEKPLFIIEAYPHHRDPDGSTSLS